MIINIKYDVGDTIEYKQYQSHKIYITCPCCNGEKSIIGQNGQKYFCPECNGVGRIDNGEEITEELVTDAIRTVHVQYDSNMNDGKVRIFYAVGRSGVYVEQENIIRRLED